MYADLDAYTDPDMMRWDPLCRAQYLEMALFMPGYLLNSQGDRMMMGNSWKAAFPFSITACGIRRDHSARLQVALPGREVDPQARLRRRGAA